MIKHPLRLITQQLTIYNLEQNPTELISFHHQLLIIVTSTTKLSIHTPLVTSHQHHAQFYDSISANCLEIQVISYEDIQLQMNYQNARKQRIPFSSHKSNQMRYEFSSQWGLAPHPDKLAKGGEDALLTSKNVLVVADGVSGWKELGVDAGLYSKKLIQIIKELIECPENCLSHIQRPYDLAIEAVQKNQLRGSATLSIITLHPYNGSLRSYHIGDSVFALFKQGNSPIVGKEQQFVFNAPFQVGGGLVANRRKSIRDGEQIGDVFKGVFNHYSYEEISEHQIVLASDGLWDNIHITDIQKQVLQCNKCIPRNSITNFIQGIHGLYTKDVYESPFYLKAKQKGITTEKKAKIDDIAIIVAKISHKRYQN